LYPGGTTKSAIEVKARLSETYKITTLSGAHQFFRIEIHRKKNCTGTTTAISRGQNVFITTILKPFIMHTAHSASTAIDPTVMLHLP
jgi:hypothetical protein